MNDIYGLIFEASNTDSLDKIQEFAASPNNRLRAYVCKNPRTPKYIIEQLAADSSELVRMFIANNCENLDIIEIVAGTSNQVDSTILKVEKLNESILTKIISVENQSKDTLKEIVKMDFIPSIHSKLAHKRHLFNELLVNKTIDSDTINIAYNAAMAENKGLSRYELVNLLNNEKTPDDIIESCLLDNDFEKYDIENIFKNNARARVVMTKHAKFHDILMTIAIS